MCGIAGIITTQHHSDIDGAISRMASVLERRGPDAQGTWVDGELGVALGHRRLSVLDLSPAGNQPMISASGRWVIVHNGEVYNHLDLRQQLESEHLVRNWRGHSDTETILACIDAWGVEATLRASAGMFAFALWDREERTLILARDRLGEKPLYFGRQGDVFLFGSELKALKVHSSFRAEIDRGALSLLLRHNCIPAPYTIYEGIYKLRPGHLVRIRHSDHEKHRAAQPEPYWSMNDVVQEGLRNQFDGSEADAIRQIETQLMESVASQMLSDVPLGAFLSGGIDSTTVVALMQVQSERPVKTFTIGFDESGHNEAAHAKVISQYLGTAHTELYVRPDDALSVIPKLASIYSEPFGDSSQIPTFLVSQLAREHVTVALSGDGGDELFGGYNRYVTARRLWGRVKKLPKFARRAIANTLHSVSPKKWDRIVSAMIPMLPDSLNIANPGDKAHKFADILTCDDDVSYFRHLTSHWKEPSKVVQGGSEPPTLLTSPEAWPEVDCLEHWMMALDTQSYLTDDILVKVDRAAMANSLETRVPMLDHRLLSLAWSMPIGLKIRGGQGKWLLRQVLSRHVPNEMIERPKMGFAVPLDDWLRGPLRDWAEDLLDSGKLESAGYLDPLPIEKMWQEHLSGKKNWQHHLWTVLMFQAWLAEDSSSSDSLA